MTRDETDSTAVNFTVAGIRALPAQIPARFVVRP